MSKTDDHSRASPRLDSLTGLRFAAAFVVFLCHASTLFDAGPLFRAWGRVAAQGVAGVSFFFILSGFVLTWSLRDGDRPKAFYRRRFARIAPAYWTALIFGVVLSLYFKRAHGVVPLWESLPSVAALQAWFPASRFYYGGNGVGWSVSAEAFFYAVFPLLARWKPATGRRLGAYVAVAAGVAIAVPVIVMPHNSYSVAGWGIYILPVQRLAEFVLGMLIAWAIRDGRRMPVPFRWAALLAVVAYFAAGWAPFYLQTVAITVIPFGILIAAAASADLDGRRTGMGGAWQRRLGEWSFAFYLVHSLVIEVIDGVLNHTGRSTAISVLAVLLALLLGLAAAVVLYTVVEAPLERRLRRARPRPDMADGSADPAALVEVRSGGRSSAS